MMKRAPGLPVPLGIVLGVLAVLLLLAFTAANAVEDKLLEPSYYNTVLARTHAYDRAYNEVAQEQVLAPEVSGLLGGAELEGLDIPTELAGAVAPSLLQEVTEDAIARIIRFMKDEDRLDLRLDITELYEAAGIFSDITEITDITGGFGGLFQDYPLSPAVEDLPTRRSASYTAFRNEITAAVDNARDDGELPSAIPNFNVPERNYDEVIDILANVSGLSDGGHDAAVTAIEDAVDDDEPATAVRIALSELTDPQTPPSDGGDGNGAGTGDGGGGPFESLGGGKFISKEGTGDNTRYFLGPPENVRKEIEDAFNWVHLISWLSPYARVVTAILLVLVLAVIAWRTYPDWPSLLRWTGWPLLVGGFIGFLAWLIGRSVAHDRIIDVTLGNNSDLPRSVQDLWRDIVDQAITELTPAIWIPTVTAVVVGALFVVGSFVVSQRSLARR